MPEQASFFNIALTIGACGDKLFPKGSDKMRIRRAKKSDIPFIEASLKAICAFHHEGRPDLFKGDGVKYTEEQLEEVLDADIVLVAEDDEELCGYLIAKPREYGSTSSMEYSSVYVDDLYVVPEKRHNGAGRGLMEEAFAVAKQRGCYNVTLNVWEFPGSAMEFYKSLGMSPMSHMMEIKL